MRRSGGSGHEAISVVVPTYRGRERLRETVPPLLADPALHELIVVVDGSEDGSVELLREWAAKDGRLRPLFVPNGGDNRARQTGLEHATGDVVLFMDDDVVAGPGLLEGHLRRHAGTTGRVVVGYMPVAPEPAALTARLYSRWYEGQCRTYEEQPDRILENLWNGNVSIRREDALRVGIPSDSYDTRYGPDRELGLRLAAAGLTGVFDRSLRAEHRYVRPPEAFLADARSAGEGIWICHRLYPSALGPRRAERFAAGMSARTRWAVRLARRRRARAPLDRALGLAAAAAGRAGCHHAEEQLATVRVRIAQQSAALAREATLRR
ncbi:MAG TPA: glycosyltransferase family 2 protein [Solirubrobacteraceae bacterium]|nr:glycosyltransferase family 2 protein [Solirubrobacteraceae bacterium]